MHSARGSEKWWGTSVVVVLVACQVTSACFVGDEGERTEGSSSAIVSCKTLSPVSATASGNDGNLPSNVLDGSLSTRWSSLGVGQFITTDFGAKLTLCSVSIAWYEGNTRKNNFTISVSSDGATFTEVYSGTSSGTTTALETYAIPQTGARYVRVTVNGNTLNRWASITEIKATGGAETVGTTETLFGAANGAQIEVSDTDSVELGVRFQAKVSGQVRSVRFYRGAATATGYTAHLWSAAGTLLGTATVQDGIVPGWQEATFSSPITIAANTTYVASYLAPTGRYAFTAQGFSAARTSGNLTAPANAGVYRYGGGFPTSVYQSTNYWVDISFMAGATPPPTSTTPPPPTTTPGPTTPGPTTPPPTGDKPACSSTISSGLLAALQSAPAGAVLCLNTGSYTVGTIGSVVKSADVVVRPADGARVSISGFALNSSQHLRFSGLGGTMSIGGIDVDTVDGQPASSWMTFDHIDFTQAISLRARSTNLHWLIDSSTFKNIAAALWEGRITVRGFQVKGDQGIVISRNLFSGGAATHSSDGVQLIDGANGVVIRGNEFTNIIQGSYPEHADPIQLYGAVNTVVDGNYFHDNGDGTGTLVDFDGTGPGTIVTNNVFVSNGIWPYSLAAHSANGWRIEHNTFVGPGYARIDGTPTNTIVRDNVWRGGGLSLAGGGVTASYNLNAGVAGTNNITGTPTFVGGATPTTYAGFALAAGSAGQNASSTGNAMGIIP